MIKTIELWKQTLHKNKSKVANRLIDDFSNLQTNGSTGAPLIDLESKQDKDQETTTQPQQAKEKIEDEAGASEVQKKWRMWRLKYNKMMK